MDKLARKSHETPPLTKAPTHDELCQAQQEERKRLHRESQRKDD